MATVTSLSDLDETPHAEVFDDMDPRVVRLELDAGERVPRHQHPDSTIVLHVVDGRLELTLGEDLYALEAGDVAKFDGEQDISPEALGHATVLVVFVPTA
ncbi:MAG: cupin domain-containing protein [Halobacteriaceae archaeon]